MDRPRHQHIDVSVSIFRLNLGWWWQRWPFQKFRGPTAQKARAEEWGRIGRILLLSTRGANPRAMRYFCKALCNLYSSIIDHANGQYSSHWWIINCTSEWQDTFVDVTSDLPRCLLNADPEYSWMSLVSVTTCTALFIGMKVFTQTKINQTKVASISTAIRSFMCTRSSSTFY